MKKRILSILTVLALCLTLLPTTAMAAGTGYFIVSGGTVDTDYSYADNVLTVKTDTELTISSSTTTADRIKVASGVTANLIFKDVSISCQGTPVELVGNAKLNLTLEDENTLEALWSSRPYAGLTVPKGSELTITAESTGSLTAKGARGGPGIGNATTRSGISAGTINIYGGRIVAQGSGRSGGMHEYTVGAGIGGTLGLSEYGTAYQCGSGTVTINGGYVTALGGSQGDYNNVTAPGIGGANYYQDTPNIFRATGNAVIETNHGITNQSDKENWKGIIFEGDNGQVYGTTQTLSFDLEIPENKTLTIPEGATLTIDSSVTLTVEGTLVNNGTVTNNGTVQSSAVISGTWGGNPAMVSGDGIIDITQGSVVITDTGYTVGNTVYTHSGPITINGNGTPTGNVITVNDSRAITLNNVIIGTDSNRTNGKSPLTIAAGNSVQLNIVGTVKLGDGWDGYHTTNVVVGDGASVTIQGNGELKCTECSGYSKINLGTGASVTINSGNVTLRTTGGNPVAGNGTFTVNGGYVKLRNDNANIFGDNVAVCLNGGTMEVYDHANQFGGASLSITGGTLKSSLENFTLKRAFTLNGGMIELLTTIPDDVKGSSTLTKGIVFEGNSGTVYGDVALSDDFTLFTTQSLTVPTGAKLTINAGATLTNKGTLTVQNGGTLTILGDAVNESSGELVVEDSAAVGKKAQEKPAAPTLASATDTTITLDTVTGGVNGVMYKAGGAFQSSPVFTGLSAEGAYACIIKYPGNEYYTDAFSDEVCFLTAPTAGTGYTIDYLNETLTVNAGYEVNTQSDFSGENVSSGATLTPSSSGDTLKYYIRRKASGTAPASAAQRLDIPPRPDKPALTVDTSAESVAIPNGYAYNFTSEDYSGDWTISPGNPTIINNFAGNLYIRIPAVTEGESKAFKSAVQTLTAPARGGQPNVAINFEGETLSTTTDMQYKVNDGNWTNCSADMKATEFGWNGTVQTTVQFRTKATGGTEGKYASEPINVTIPARPTAPDSSAYTIDYFNEEITFDSSYRVNTAADFKGEAVSAGSIRDRIPAAGSSDNTVYIRKAATADAFASAVLSITIPARPTAPDATHFAVTQPSVFGGTGSIGGLHSGFQYSTDNGNTWTIGNGQIITDIPGGTTYLIRFPAMDNIIHRFHSEHRSITINTFVGAKENTPNIEIDYALEKLTGFDPAGTYTIDGVEVAPTDGALPVVDYMESTISIVKKGNGTTTTDSDCQLLPVPGRLSVPIGLQGYNTSFVGESDGTITGVTVDMEYKLSAANGWTSCTGDTITGLAAGTYQVRTKAAGSAFASIPAGVTIGSGEERTYTLNVAVPAFEAVDYGYIQPAAKGITISSTGNSDATISGVALSGSGAEAFILNKTDGIVLTAGGTDSTTYTVQPKAELNKGDYNAVITVTYNDGAAAVATVSFTVNSSKASGGSSSSTYTPAVEKSEGGTMDISPRNPVKGDKVTVAAKPDQGKEVEKITVTDRNGNPVEVKDNGDGTYSFTQPAGKVTVEVTYWDKEQSEIGETKPILTNPFTDVNEGDYFYDAVLWAAEQGITGGTGNGSFSPDATCTRDQVVTFLWHAAGSPTPAGTAIGFEDVSKDAYYYDAVLWAAEQGITGGTGNGSFSPDATCTRDQVVTFLWRAAGSPAVSGSAAFSDVAADSYYANAVAWAAQNNITGGIGDGLFGPANDCTRAQIVTFLYRWMTA